MSSNIFFWRKPKPFPSATLAPVAVAARSPLVPFEDGIELGDGQRWNPAEISNAHVVVIGASGSGKTQTLKAIAYALSKEYARARIVLIDFHGDQDLEGETCFAFNRASPHGINLLKVNLDIEGGGVSLQTISVVRSMKSPLQIGANQEGVLLDAIKRAYALCGLDDAKPETWTKQPPTFADVREVLEADDGKESAKLMLKLASFFEYGIFSRHQPDLLAAPVTRVDLSRLPPALQAIAAESLAAQMMNEHRLMGEMEGKEPRTYLFVDEAKELRGSPSLDRIIADGRKYGLALILASQSERHLSLDVIANSSTKIVLPVDQTEVTAVARKFRFAEEHVAALTQLTALCRFGAQSTRIRILPYYKRVMSDE